MLSNNILKLQEKPFHVEEDFFEEMINGLQTEKEREASRGESRPVILLPKQARYFKKTTVPILVKQFQRNGFIESYFQQEYNAVKQYRMQLIRGYFTKAFGELYKNDKLVDEFEDEKVKSNSLSVFNLLRLYRLFRNVSRIYVALKKFEKTEEMENFSIQDYDFKTAAGYDQFERDLSSMVGSMEKALPPVFVELIKPIAKEMVVMYDSLLEKLFQKLMWYCVKKAIVPDDWLDWTLLALEVGAFVAGVIFTGGTASAAMAKIGGAARLMKFTNAIRKISKTLMNAMEGVKGFSRAMRIGSAVVKGGIKGVKWMMPKYTRTGWRISKKGGWKLRSARIIWSGIDLWDVTREDVEDYRKYLQRRTRIWGAKLEVVLFDDLKRIGETIGDISLGVGKLKTSVVQSRLADDMTKQQMINAKLSERYGRIISLNGYEDLTVVQVLGFTRDKLSSIFSDAASSLEEIEINDNDVSKVNVKDNENEIVLQFSKGGNNIEKRIKKLEKGKEKENKSKLKIQEGTFNRFYRNGVAVGFSALLENGGKTVDMSVYKNNTKYNIKGSQSGSNDIKNNFELTLDKSGLISLEYKSYTEMGSSLFNILENKNKEIAKEEETQRLAILLLDKITRRLEGLGDIDSQNIKDALKILEENQEFKGRRLVENDVYDGSTGTFTKYKAWVTDEYKVEGYDANKWKRVLEMSDTETAKSIISRIKNLPTEAGARYEALKLLTETYIGVKK